MRPQGNWRRHMLASWIGLMADHAGLGAILGGAGLYWNENVPGDRLWLSETSRF